MLCYLNVWEKLTRQERIINQGAVGGEETKGRRGSLYIYVIVRNNTKVFCYPIEVCIYISIYSLSLYIVVL